MNYYNIDQYRDAYNKNKIDTYRTEIIKYSISAADTSTNAPQYYIDINNIEPFQDACIINNNGNFEAGTPYRLTFKIKSLLTSQKIIIKLVETEAIDGVLQEKTDVGEEEIETITVVANDDPDASSIQYEVFFVPDKAYNTIKFELQRTSADFSISGENGIKGRQVVITEYHIEEIENILALEALNGRIIRKLGLQGPTGLTFVIDGEIIRIGKSGIYELYNDDLTIEFIGVILDEGQAFIMDYKY